MELNAEGTQFTCITSTKVQILTAELNAEDLVQKYKYLHLYKRTNTDI
jgi:hypothetical protein